MLRMLGLLYSKSTYGTNRHICSNRLCHQFYTYHLGYCNIQRVEVKKSKPYCLVFFNFQCTQTKKFISKTGKEKYIHEPNFIGAIIECTLCISNGKWTKSLKNDPCIICGKNRTVSFAPFVFSQTEVVYVLHFKIRY